MGLELGAEGLEFGGLGVGIGVMGLEFGVWGSGVSGCVGVMGFEAWVVGFRV